MPKHNGTVAWVAQSADLGAAVQEVRRSAVGQNTPGFMLAFMRSGDLGFSFLVYSANFSAALHLVQERGWHSSPKYTCASEQGTGLNYPFVEKYLETVAANMQAVDYRQLVTHFAERKSGWRFQPWEGGRPSYSRDNDYTWREYLWPLVRGIVEVPPPCLGALPTEVRTAVLEQLRGHAREGMIAQLPPK